MAITRPATVICSPVSLNPYLNFMPCQDTENTIGIIPPPSFEKSRATSYIHSNNTCEFNSITKMDFGNNTHSISENPNNSVSVSPNVYLSLDTSPCILERSTPDVTPDSNDTSTEMSFKLNPNASAFVRNMPHFYKDSVTIYIFTIFIFLIILSSFFIYSCGLVSPFPLSGVQSFLNPCAECFIPSRSHSENLIPNVYETEGINIDHNVTPECVTADTPNVSLNVSTACSDNSEEDTSQLVGCSLFEKYVSNTFLDKKDVKHREVSQILNNI